MIKETVRRFVPNALIEKVRGYERRRVQKHMQSLPALSADDLRTLLVEEMNVSRGDLLFVHSSVDRLNLAFPFFQILAVLRDLVGKEGTLLFPTYPPLSSYRYLKSGGTFDIRKSPSYTGILSEFARRQRAAIRSLHPTKSVAAIGPLSEQITANHQESPFPYDRNSPYFRFVENNGRAIGIGVGTFNLSMVHTVDDIMGADFPVDPYHPELLSTECVDYEGEKRIVSTYAHDMKKMDFDIPEYMERHISDKVARDITHNGMRFFTAQAKPLYDRMTALAHNNITIYRKRHYR